MVIHQKQTPTTHVARRRVIDGQQRLTTFQIDLAEECEAFTFNRGRMVNPEIDRFKVWPTQTDREQFRDVMESGSRSELERRHPPVRKRYARRYAPRPRSTGPPGPILPALNA